MMRDDEFADRGFELRDAAVGTTAQLFVRQLGEPAFHEIEPRSVRRREMDVEPRGMVASCCDSGSQVK